MSDKDLFRLQHDPEECVPKKYCCTKGGSKIMYDPTKPCGESLLEIDFNTCSCKGAGWATYSYDGLEACSSGIIPRWNNDGECVRLESNRQICPEQRGTVHVVPGFFTSGEEGKQLLGVIPFTVVYSVEQIDYPHAVFPDSNEPCVGEYFVLIPVHEVYDARGYLIYRIYDHQYPDGGCSEAFVPRNYGGSGIEFNEGCEAIGDRGSLQLVNYYDSTKNIKMTPGGAGTSDYDSVCFNFLSEDPSPDPNDEDWDCYWNDIINTFEYEGDAPTGTLNG